MQGSDPALVDAIYSFGAKNPLPSSSTARTGNTKVRVAHTA